jgi:hypothetical protein
MPEAPLHNKNLGKENEQESTTRSFGGKLKGTLILYTNIDVILNHENTYQMMCVSKMWISAIQITY